MNEKTNFNVIEKNKSNDILYITNYINTIVNGLIVKEFRRKAEWLAIKKI